MQRALRRSWALGLIATGACLVTDEVRFQPPSNLTGVMKESPLPFARFPFGGDPVCRDRGQAGSMWFSVQLHDRDVEAPLYGFWLVNGALETETPFPATSTLSVDRTGGECLKNLDRRCNFVQLVVSSSFEDLRRVPLLVDSFDVAHAEWFVIGPSDQQPEASQFDCMALFADAGADAGSDAAAEGGVQ